MLSSGDLAGAATGHQDRQVVRVVLVRVPDRRPVEDHEMVQQRAIAVLRRPELQQEVGEELHVIRVDLRQLLDLLGCVLVMAERVVRL